MYVKVSTALILFSDVFAVKIALNKHTADSTDSATEFENVPNIQMLVYRFEEVTNARSCLPDNDTCSFDISQRCIVSSC